MGIDRVTVFGLIKVIVDLREFNSALPSAIYRAGIDLQLATLEVGDYILSPSICVERKAHADLEQSLQSGRVFKQIDQVGRVCRCVWMVGFADVAAL
jgi:DNA excision repair protein ERCC-4